MNRHVPADERPSFAARRADALGVLAEFFIKTGGAPMNGGERHQIVVHVGAETLRDSTAGQCEVEDGPSIPAETARRLACDCSAVIIVENDKGEPLNVGRRWRVPLHSAGRNRIRQHRAPTDGDWTRLLIQHEESDIHIDKKTATTRWRGERMDYSIAVESLVTKWRRGNVASPLLVLVMPARVLLRASSLHFCHFRADMPVSLAQMHRVKPAA